MVLADKYRPRSFAQVVGQPLAVAALSAAIDNGSGAALLLVGPSGTGKTTAARIFAASLICERNGGQPCGKCGDCESILSGRFCYGYYEQDGGRFTGLDSAKVLSDLLTSAPFGKLVVFLDEVQAIDAPAANALLKAIEHPSSPAVFIGATTDERAVPPALRKRCRLVRFKPLTGSQTFEMLASVCQQEAIRFMPRALDMIAAASDGSMRDALIRLEQVAEQGDLTEALVADTLCFGATDELVRYLVAVGAGDLPAQEASINEWQALPEEKHRLVRDCLLFIYNRQVAPTKLDHIIDPAFHQISELDQKRIVDGFRRCAGGRDLGKYFFDLFAFWEVNPTVHTDRSSLLARMMRFHRAVNAQPAASHPPTPDIPPPLAATRKRQFRARSAKGSSDERKASGHYLSASQVEHLYEASSFLAQDYGVLFNTLIHLDHAALGAADEAQASRLVSRLTHSLSLRVKVWSPHSEAHWVYVNRIGKKGPESDIILHLPPESLDQIDRWLRMQFENGGGGLHSGWVLDAASSGRAAGWQSNRVQRHWFLVRKLWGGMDPQVHEWDTNRCRRPLLDLLGVKKADRRPVGNLRHLRAIGSSRSLGPDRRNRAASERMTTLSALKDDAWESLFSGWELEEFRDRRLERERRREARRRVELEYPVSTNPLEIEARKSALASLEADWPADPKLRLRSWKGWWA